MSEDPKIDSVKTGQIADRGGERDAGPGVERQSAEVELNRAELPSDPDSTLDPDEATARDWAVANDARPDMIEETADGLDETDEAVRRAAEND